MKGYTLKELEAVVSAFEAVMKEQANDHDKQQIEAIQNFSALGKSSLAKQLIETIKERDLLLEKNEKVANIRPPVTQDGYSMGWFAARDEIHKILFGEVRRKPIPELSSIHVEILKKLKAGKTINGMSAALFWFKRGKIQYSRALLAELQGWGLVDDDCKITHSGEVNLIAAE